MDFKAVNMVINYHLSTCSITYFHRIGRCGRAGRHGQAITLFTKADFVHRRTYANVMNQSCCREEEWMLQLKQSHHHHTKQQQQPQHHRPILRRSSIDTTPRYGKRKNISLILQMIQESKRKKQRDEQEK
jgi:superfamily II DNA/RNA helicase